MQSHEQSASSSDSAAWPVVTVVVPTRERPEMLRRAVEAVLGQDYAGEIECLVVFDRTTPQQPQVEVPAGRSLKLLVNARTPGLAGTRNTGTMAARGELVAQCDDDDEWLPGKLTAQVEALRRYPDAVAVTTGILVNYHDEDTPRVATTERTTFQDLLRDRLMELHPSSYLIRRSALLGEVGLVDEELPGGYAEDYEWLLRASRVAPVVNVLEPLTRVYWHDSSFFVSRWQTVIDALTTLLERYPEFAEVPAGLGRIEGQIAFAHAGLGHRGEAMRWARSALAKSRSAKQAYAAVAVASGVMSTDAVLGLARKAGRGL